MDLGLGKGIGENQEAFGSAYGLLADVATRYCSAEFLSLVRRCSLWRPFVLNTLDNAF